LGCPANFSRFFAVILMAAVPSLDHFECGLAEYT